MDRLVSDVVRSPDVLLGLPSWRLHPDLLVLGTGKTEPIKQQGLLIGEGVLLTFAIQRMSDTNGSLFWSLPLFYLRYCGDPVLIKGYIGPSCSRISSSAFTVAQLSITEPTKNDFPTHFVVSMHSANLSTWPTRRIPRARLAIRYEVQRFAGRRSPGVRVSNEKSARELSLPPSLGSSLRPPSTSAGRAI